MPKKTRKYIITSAWILAVLVILDQLTKWIAVTQLKNKEAFVLIPGVFELRYLENQSAAFGMDIVTFFQKIFHISYFIEHPDAFLFCKMIVLVVFTLIIFAAMGILFFKIPVLPKFRYLDWIFIALGAGAIGNCIDRVCHNYVVDFFYFSLIDFPIFNVADIYVTLGAAFLILLFLFYYKEEDFNLIFPDKKKTKKEA